MNLIPTRKADVSFVDDYINITSKVAKTLDLHDGDAINIWVEGCEHYLYKSAAGNGCSYNITVKRPKKNCNFFRAYNVKLSRYFQNIMGGDCYLATGAPTEISVGIAVPIITHDICKRK